MAARFDTTPSELAILNRLSSRTVFPGQILRVPDKKRISVSESDASQVILNLKYKYINKLYLFKIIYFTLGRS